MWWREGGSAQINKDQPLGVAAARPRGSKLAAWINADVCGCRGSKEGAHCERCPLFHSRTTPAKIRHSVGPGGVGGGDKFIPRLATVRVCVFGNAFFLRAS